MSIRHPAMFLLGAMAIAACATSGGSGEGTGTVGGGGRIDSGGDGPTPSPGSDDGGAPGTDAGMMMSDTGSIVADSSPTDTGTMDASPTGHIECPTTLYYANEYVTAPPTATVCTMGGPECRANVECCYIDACVPYP